MVCNYTHSICSIYLNGIKADNIDIYTYQTEETAKTNSMNYSICRVEVNDKWVYYYRGKKINISIHSY